MLRHAAHKIRLVYCCQLQYDLDTSIGLGPPVHQAFWLDTENTKNLAGLAQSVVPSTDTLGQLGCMWLACRIPSSSSGLTSAP